VPTDRESSKAVETPTPEVRKVSDAFAVPAPQSTSLPPEAIAATTANIPESAPATQAQLGRSPEAPAGQ
jgi:hypothetical protein